jgi:hypothetical protein
MGQTVSWPQNRKALFVSNDLVDDDTLSQVLLRNSGLSANHIIPKPGWMVFSTPMGIVLRFKPHLNLLGQTFWDNSCICTMKTAASVSTEVILFPMDDQVWDGTDATDLPWVKTNVIDTPFGTSTFVVDMPPFAILPTELHRLCNVRSINAQGTVTFTATPDHLYVRNNMLFRGRALPPGEHTVTLTGRDNRGQTSSKTMELLITDTEYVDDPPDPLVLNAHDYVTLEKSMLAFPDTSQELSALPTHFMFQIPDGISASGASDTAGDIIVIETENLGNIRFSRQLTRTRSGVEVSDNRNVVMPLWMSFDNGLSFPLSSLLCIQPFPCFDMQARVCVGFQRGKMLWKRLCSLRRGDRIMCKDNRFHTVRSVLKTAPMTVMMMQIPRNAFGPGQPNRNLKVTTNHRVWLPRTGGPIPAGKLRQAKRQQHTRLRLCHVELDSYQYPLVDGIYAESYAKGSIARRMREGRGQKRLCRVIQSYQTRRRMVMARRIRPERISHPVVVRRVVQPQHVVRHRRGVRVRR